MKNRFCKCACIALFGGLTLYGLEMLAQGQTTGGTTTGGTTTGGTTTGGGRSSGGGGGGSSITGGGMSGNNTAGFTGGDTSGSFSGTSNTAKSKGTGSGTQIPSASNLFGPNYVNPYSRGIKSTSGKVSTGSFNTALYAPTTTTGKGASAKGGGRTSSAATTAEGFSTSGIDRAVPYVTNLDPELALPSRESSAFLADLRDIVQRSSQLKSKDKIIVAVNDGVVVLRGEVASAAERGLVERMLLLEPGVRNIDNQLSIAGQGKQ